MNAGSPSFWVVRPAKRHPVKVWTPKVLKKKKSPGFTMLAMLLFVGITGAALAAVGELASHAMQREKEAQLLFVGDQYREAIASYYNRTPGAVKRYPASVDDLLDDKRFPVPQRHLRKAYLDPLTGQPFVTVEAPQGGIMGVRSRSEAEPVKTANFLARDEAFTDSTKYSQWQFVFTAGNQAGKQ